jgi:Sensors of blue-light using FAD
MSATTDGETGLVSLVYVSSSIQQLTGDEILDILRTARQKNERMDITGMLLYKDGNFMQALEGPRAQIENLMGSIGRDRRHRGLIQLVNKPIPDRQFAKWSMAFTDLDQLSAKDADAYSPFLKGSLLDEEFRNKPELSYRLLLHFKTNLR